MNLSCYKYPVEKRLKKIGHVSIHLKHITQIKYKRSADFEELTPFTYKVFKNGLGGKRKLNTVIEFNDQRLYVCLSKWGRRKMYLMFKDHWYYNNFITRFYIKHFGIISPLTLLGVSGFKLYKAIVGLTAGFAIFKGCH